MNPVVKWGESAILHTADSMESALSVGSRGETGRQILICKGKEYSCSFDADRQNVRFNTCG